jgi:hypothetical protein
MHRSHRRFIHEGKSDHLVKEFGNRCCCDLRVTTVIDNY